MAFINVTWHTRGDDKVCPVCKAIEGYTWVFEIGKGELNGQLVHPEHNVVWDVQSGSRAHGHQGNCRCNLTYEVHVEDLIQKTNSILEAIRGMVPRT